MRILLVEDEPDLGAAIAIRLRQEKYVVDWAKDGAEAWNYLESQWTQYTVGIFDLMLRTASGEPTKSEALGFGAQEFAPWMLGATM